MNVEKRVRFLTMAFVILLILFGAFIYVFATGPTSAAVQTRVVQLESRVRTLENAIRSAKTLDELKTKLPEQP
jgi:hypothetical protein